MIAISRAAALLDVNIRSDVTVGLALGKSTGQQLTDAGVTGLEVGVGRMLGVDGLR